MALSKSGKKGSNVLNLDELRKQRSNPKKSTSTLEKATPTRRKSDQSQARKVDDQATEGISTPAKRSRVSNRRFDKVKVDRIKAELANGDYKINYLQVADKFIEHERYT